MAFITALGLAVGAVTIRSGKSKNLVPAAVIGKLLVAIFAIMFIENFTLIEKLSFKNLIMLFSLLPIVIFIRLAADKEISSSLGK